MSKSDIWLRLKELGTTKSNLSLRSLFEENPQRADQFTLAQDDLFFDYSKNQIDQEVLEALLELADHAQLKSNIDALYQGEQVNTTEHRSALHTLLRAPKNSNDHPYLVEVHQVLAQVKQFVNSVHTKEWRGCSDKPITDIVNLGVGGSDLGPNLAADSLHPYHIDDLRVHYVSNIDGTDIYHCLEALNPETTLFVVASKSFTTLETLSNARHARNWILTKAEESDVHKHFIAVAANVPKAVEFGINKENIYPMWDWVGGRYSLWSAIGLSIALAIGWENFEKLLAGAHAMDRHFQEAPFQQNMPVLLALVGIWHTNILGMQSYAVIPYSSSLKLLPSYLQQLEMESNGKGVTHNGHPVQTETCPILWGGVGSNTQHSFHQLLHQGTHKVPVDFILPLQSHYPLIDHHTHLVANCLSQSQALAFGTSMEEIEAELQSQGMTPEEAKQFAPHKVIPGNKPHNLITLTKLTPYALGQLIALYEHKVFVQSVIWDINAFDQWGVELGKQLSQQLFYTLNPRAPESKMKVGFYSELDDATKRIVNMFRDINALPKE